MEGRCEDCTLEERLKALQVLRFVPKSGCGPCYVRDKGMCMVSGDRPGPGAFVETDVKR